MDLPMTPTWWFAIPAIVCGLLALLLLGGRSGGFGRLVRTLLGLALLLVALGLGGVAAGLRGWLDFGDRPVATLLLRQEAPQRYRATLTRVNGDAREYTLAGDEWQLDARVIRWRLPAQLAGLPPMYRLERLSGRYGDLQLEREAPRTVHALDTDALPDLWTLRRRFPNWLPFVDARFGSAAYLPMLDGARYEIAINPRGGLVVKPADDATQRRLDESGW